MKEEVYKKVDEVFNSLNGLQRAEASLFLYSKIRNRLDVAKQVVPLQLAWRLVTIMVIVIVMNLFTIRYFGSKEKNNDTGIELVANEYSISLPQTY